MRFSIYQDTAIGARSVNQDRMGYCFTSDSLLMVVADGMGGHIRGEVAAQVTLQSVGSMFQAEARPRIIDPVKFLDNALRKAHRDILRYQAQNGLPEAPRTTVVAAVVQESKIWWAHAGDSRLYLVRGAQVIGRTRDHSKVQTLVALGLIQPGEEDQHPERNKVLNCLGSPFEPTVEINPPVRLQSADRILLCTDGVWSGFSEKSLCAALTSQSVDSAIPEIIRQALASNGRIADNATAIGLVWEGDGAPVSDRGEPLLENAFTTTIVEEIPNNEIDRDITEDEIERTIHEIRTAIERSNSR